MFKSKFNISFIILLVLAIVIGVGMVQFLQSTRTQIFVFANDYLQGETIREDMLLALEVEKSMVDAVRASRRSEKDAVFVTPESVKEMLGQKLQSNVLRGMPLMSNHGSEFGGVPAEARLEDGMIAFTVMADKITSGNPNIIPGSRVNVYAAYTTDDQSRISNLLLQDIKVVDVLRFEEEDENLVEGVTLEVTAEQANALSFAEEFGTIRLGLIKNGTYEEASVGTYTFGNVLSE